MWLSTSGTAGCKRPSYGRINTQIPPGGLRAQTDLQPCMRGPKSSVPLSKEREAYAQAGFSSNGVCRICWIRLVCGLALDWTGVDAMSSRSTRVTP